MTRAIHRKLQAAGGLCYGGRVALNRFGKQAHRALAVASLALFGVGLGGGCATTEYLNEGPGQPSDRASGTVPPGSLGVCKVRDTKRPVIVDQTLWDNARVCNSRTPRGSIRLGWGKAEAPGDPEADKRMESILETLRESPKEEGGNDRFTAMMRKIRDASVKDPELRSRVSRERVGTSVCDFTYLLNTMVKERAQLDDGNMCSAQAYDQKQRGEKCIFDVGRPDAVWVSSAWDCVAQTNEMGDEQSCHRLCAYDDYCTRQVSCAASDLDLLLCVMGVCLPEQRAGF